MASVKLVSGALCLGCLHNGIFRGTLRQKLTSEAHPWRFWAVLGPGWLQVIVTGSLGGDLLLFLEPTLLHLWSPAAPFPDVSCGTHLVLSYVTVTCE